MALHKYRLGELIEASTANNKNLAYGHELIRGVTNEGIFSMPKGDVSNVDLAPYKIVRNGEFVYNPTRIDLGSLAYRNEGLCIVSHLYTVFHLNRNGLQIFDPMWLMMYFHRSEFYREITFRNFGSQRPEFNFKKMSEIELMVPSLDVQRKYVAIYEAMLKNQQAYERGLEDLKTSYEVALKAICKSSKYERIESYIEAVDVRNSGNFFGVNKVVGLSINKTLIPTKANLSGVSLSNYKIVSKYDFVYVPVTSRNGEKISVALNGRDESFITSSINTVFRVKADSIQQLLPEYLMLFFNRSEFDRYARFNSWGSARETFDWNGMLDVTIPLPSLQVQQSIVNLYKAYTLRSEINERLKSQLKDICPVLIKGSIEEASR